MSDLNVLAAGSLRLVWDAVMAAFYQQSGIQVNIQYGPAGLLRQRIEQGEVCDLFASANEKHPRTLKQNGLALQIGIFTHNRLCPVRTATTGRLRPGLALRFTRSNLAYCDLDAGKRSVR